MKTFTVTTLVKLQDIEAESENEAYEKAYEALKDKGLGGVYSPFFMKEAWED